MEKHSVKLQEDLKLAQKLDLEQKTKIHNLEEELKKITAERDKYKKESEERQQTIDKMQGDQKDSKEAILKLEEARIVLNRLLGPGGSFTDQQRDKFLKGAAGANLPEAQIGPST